jgi:hypothetical protein
VEERVGEGEDGGAIVSEDGEAHMPPPRDVPLSFATENAWEVCNGGEIEDVLKSGAIVLLDGQWMVNWAESKRVLRPRQALPDEAFLTLEEVKQVGVRQVVCLSHCWLQRDHPDPFGYNLGVVARALKPLLKFAKVAIFYDFCSMHQKCRSVNGSPQSRVLGWANGEEGAIGRYACEDRLFKQALSKLGAFYSHRMTKVWMLSRFPVNYEDPASGYLREGNVAEYLDRGWCFCESSWASMVKDSLALLDLGKDTGRKWEYFSDVTDDCTVGRTAPLKPELFEAQLQCKHFTNGKDDKPMVTQLYREAFVECFRKSRTLSYRRLGWGVAEATAVAAVLRLGSCLVVELNLEQNCIGDDGAMHIGEALQINEALTSLKCVRAHIPTIPSRMSLRRNQEWGRWRAH